MKNLKLTLRRLSSLPNNFKNYCYAVLSEVPAGIDGIVNTPQGPCIYSFARIGTLNKDFTTTVNTRKVGERTFINLVDTAADGIGEIAYLAGMSIRAGI